MTMYTIKGCNIRQGASTEYDVIGTLSKGEAVKITGKVNEVNWYEISLSEDKKGYVSGNYLVADNPVKQETAQKLSMLEQTPEQTTGTPNTTDANGVVYNEYGEPVNTNPYTGEVLKLGDSYIDAAGVETTYFDTY